MVIRVLTAICLWVLLSSGAAAEDVVVKYREGTVSLDTFKCESITKSTFVNRVCYDAAQEYMIIQLQDTYYHYCEIDQGTVDGLLSAVSLGKFFNANIKGSGLRTV